jgi:hypothetical protein
MVANSAVGYEVKGATKPALGSIGIEADTKVSVSERLVNFEPLQITGSNVPTLKKEQLREVVAATRASFARAAATSTPAATATATGTRAAAGRSTTTAPGAMSRRHSGSPARRRRRRRATAAPRGLCRPHTAGTRACGTS